MTSISLGIKQTVALNDIFDESDEGIRKSGISKKVKQIPRSKAD